MVHASQFLEREALLTLLFAMECILKPTELWLSNRFIVNNLVGLMYLKG